MGREAVGGGAGFYFHIQPGTCFAGGGMWMPPKEALHNLRDAIAEDPRPFERMVTTAAVTRRFGGLDTEATLLALARQGATA